MRRSLFLLCLLCALAPCAAAQTRRPNVNVERKEAPTPEVHSTIPNELQSGQTTTIIVHGANFNSETSEAAASGDCKLNSFKYVSPTEIQFNVTAERKDEGGSCDVQVKTGQRYVSGSITVAMTAAGRAKEQARQQEELRNAQQQQANRLAHNKDILGRKWDVKLPNGKNDTWTLAEVNQFGFAQFKNSKGEELMIMVGEKDNIVVQGLAGGACMFTGAISNGKVTDGQSPLPNCPLGGGAWTATITK